MASKYALLLLIAFPISLQAGCGGMSQDDLRAYALPNDDEEEVAPAPPPAAAPPAAPVNPAPPAQPPNTPAPQPVEAAPMPAASGGTPAAGGEAAPLVSGGDFDAPLPAAISKPVERNSSTSTATVLPEDELGPMPVLGPDPSTEETEALRIWQVKRAMLAEKLEMEAQLAAEQKVRVNPQPGVSPDAVAAAENPAEYERQLLQAIFARLTNPESLAPEELARVAQELSAQGNTRESLAYHHGWLLTTDNNDKIKNAFHWVPILQRPLSAIHWGIGVEYEGPVQLLSNPNPIQGDTRPFENPQRIAVSNKLRPYLGELGERLLFGLESRIASGSMGKLFIPPVAANPHEPQQPTVHVQWEMKQVGFNPESLGRGITLLGGGTRKELLHFARLQEIDVLVIFDIEARQPRTGPVVNTTSLILWDVLRSREINSTKSLNNIKVHAARLDRSQKDPVTRFYEDLFSEIDTSFRPAPLPASLKEEQARQRVETLAASEPIDLLATMAEMRLYQSLGLIGDAALYDGYKVLIGDADAKKLITGNGSERVAAISRFLPRVMPIQQ